jgi:hypothetical protein
MLFSLGPALKATRADLVKDLKEQVGEPARIGRLSRFFAPRHISVMAQIALSLMLLFSAGLFFRGALKAAGLNPGFEAAGDLVTEFVLVADEYVGAVMSDLSGRRGRVGGTEPVGAGRTLIRAEVPQLEVTRYAVDLRSLSHGTATFTRSYQRHDPMPPQLAQRVQADSATAG